VPGVGSGSINFRDPASGLTLYCSNGKWGRTCYDRHPTDLTEKQRAAFV
jgi:hypothetical protein